MSYVKEHAKPFNYLVLQIIMVAYRKFKYYTYITKSTCTSSPTKITKYMPVSQPLFMFSDIHNTITSFFYIIPLTTY